MERVAGMLFALFGLCEVVEVLQRRRTVLVQQQQQ